MEHRVLSRAPAASRKSDPDVKDRKAGSEPFPHRSPDSWGRGEVNRRQRHTDAWDCLSLAGTDWAGQEKSRVKVIYGSSLSGLVERGEKVPVSQEGTSGVSPS